MSADLMDWFKEVVVATNPDFEYQNWNESSFGKAVSVSFYDPLQEVNGFVWNTADSDTLIWYYLSPYPNSPRTSSS